MKKLRLRKASPFAPSHRNTSGYSWQQKPSELLLRSPSSHPHHCWQLRGRKKKDRGHTCPESGEGRGKKCGVQEGEPLGFKPYSQPVPHTHIGRKPGAQDWNHQVYSDITDGLNQHATLIGIMGNPEDSLTPAPSIWAENCILKENFPIWGLTPLPSPTLRHTSHTSPAYQ